MKKLIYALILIGFAGNINAQRIQEELVQTTDPAKATEYKEENVYIMTTCCFCGNSRTNQNSSIERLETLVNKTEFDFNEDRIILQSLSQPDISIITQEDIKRVPNVGGEADIISTLKLMGCPGSINVDDDITACSEIQVIEPEVLPFMSDVTVTNERSTQGPITGLEGHNFIEEPAIIYPNPVKDIMHIKSTDPITVIEILNAHGQVEKILHINEEMIVSDLAAGIYYARISFEDRKEVQVEKILIVK